MKRKRVVQLITAMSDGGAETLVKDYSIMLNGKIFNDTMFEVIIVTIHNDIISANFQRIKAAGIKIIPIYKHHNKAVSLHRELFGKYYIPAKLKTIFDNIRPDCIHIHLSLLRYLLPIANSLKDYRLLYTCHNEARLMLDGKRKKEAVAARYLIKQNGLTPIALHNKMAEEINNILQTNSTVVLNNGVDFNKFGQSHILKSRAEIRKSIGIPINAFVIGHIGRFSEQKNHVFLLDVFKCVLSHNSNSYLLLVGDGPNKKLIMNKADTLNITQRVIILSHRTDTPQLYCAMDVFVFPSLFEGLPVTMVEAQASGLKCVVSDRINSQSILSENTHVVKLEDDIEKWTDTILEEKHNYNYGVLEDYDMNNVIQKLVLLYIE